METKKADIPAEEVVEDKEEEIVTGSDSESSSESSSDSESEYECDICQKTFAGYLPFKQHQKGKKHAKAVLKRKKEKKLLKMEESEESDEEHIVAEMYAECKTCRKEFYGPEAYEKHLKSKKHKQKTLQASILEQVKVDGKVDETKLRELCKKKGLTDNVLADETQKIRQLTLEDEDEEAEFECKECEKLFSGLIPYTQHLMSKSHSKKVEKKTLLDKVVPETAEEESDKSNQRRNTLCIEDDVLVCKACSTSFSGPENAMTHLKSKKHAKKFEKYLRKIEKKKQKEESAKDGTKNNRKDKKQVENEGDDRTDEGNLPSSSSVNESLIGYEKYKKYKDIMNSLKENES